MTIAVSATADVAPAVSSVVSRPYTFGGSPSSATSGHGITSTSYTFAVECAPKLHSTDQVGLYEHVVTPEARVSLAYVSVAKTINQQ